MPTTPATESVPTVITYKIRCPACRSGNVWRGGPWVPTSDGRSRQTARCRDCGEPFHLIDSPEMANVTIWRGRPQRT